jgi:hypothetical protein
MVETPLYQKKSSIEEGAKLIKRFDINLLGPKLGDSCGSLILTA